MLMAPRSAIVGAIFKNRNHRKLSTKSGKIGEMFQKVESGFHVSIVRFLTRKGRREDFVPPDVVGR
jgi:hypothetical protein